MSYRITSSDIRNNKIKIVYSENEYKGVKKIAGRLADDMKAVFGVRPDILEVKCQDKNFLDNIVNPIVIGTLGVSHLEAVINLNQIEGKREVYCLSVKEHKNNNELVIAGSDKRGTIYGIFKLSELLGVSPFIDWLEVKPDKRREFTFKKNYSYSSKEPSVRYRGLFINDEWPAFGNFCKHNYGGFNAKVYEHVFELILRLKGNYMWPAMWSAIFPNDGPNLANAELADEMGIVMGASHHEPCLRQGEEYKYLRGKDSIYGDAWNFITNREGITRFWEDGLRRSGKFENVITVGMRGEADTAIMGHEATLADNINLLREVLKTQNRIIRENVNPNIDEVPRMLALYKEVEPYFYGDEETPGLMGDPELEGVTLMLCDDNYGNLRTVPTEKMRSHKGGYGMYYHFDYHGLPVSFEWVNTSYLPKVWEQMTAAYDFGIRDLWIVNVGDIFSNEYPLAFFMDLAYDFERWGTDNLNACEEYNKLFVERAFGEKLSSFSKSQVTRLLASYTKITSCRRTEAMNSDIYAPWAYDECENLLQDIDSLERNCTKIYQKLNTSEDKHTRATAFPFYELIYFPLMANLNVQKMWLYSSRNQALANIGSTAATMYAERIKQCIIRDKELVNELHTTHRNKWYGMGLSEHIGFKYWCEEECAYPIVYSQQPANKDRLIALIPGTNQHTEGRIWTGRTMTIGAFLNPGCCERKQAIALSTAGARVVDYKIKVDDGFEGKLLNVTESQGRAVPGRIKYIGIKVNRELLEGTRRLVSESAPIITIISDSNASQIRIRVPINTLASLKAEEYPSNTYLWCGEPKVNLGNVVTGMPSYTRVLPEGANLCKYISIEAEHYSNCSSSSDAVGSFRVIPDYGKTLSGLKAYPQECEYSDAAAAPSVSYRVVVPDAGCYCLEFYTNPSNPRGREGHLLVGVSVNGGKIEVKDFIPDDFTVGDGNMHWQRGVLDNIRRTTIKAELQAGLNMLNVYAMSPNLVLEKIVIYPENQAPTFSYLGPTETYRID